MKIISLDNREFEAEASVGTVDDVSGLILESRGGGPTERNRDYLPALECIISRLEKVDVKQLQVYLVSSVAMQLWDMKNRMLTFDGQNFIPITDKIVQIRKKISKAQQDKKKDPTKRILLSADLGEHTWQEIIFGSNSMK